MVQDTRCIRVGLLTGGKDPHYACGLTIALAEKGILVDVIGSDELDGSSMRRSQAVRFLNLRGRQDDHAGVLARLHRVVTYYLRLIAYAAVAEPKIFHILWNNSFPVFDRTVLMAYYRLLGRRLALTAHNINAGRRDSNDTLINRLTLRIQYRLCHHIFVHTDAMKRELVRNFAVGDANVTVIPYGLNDAVPVTELTSRQAKQQLRVREGEKTILFFGNIAPYKGLDVLVAAFDRLLVDDGDYRLIVAGKPKRGAERYWRDLAHRLEPLVSQGRVTLHIGFIPDGRVEHYFKAADVLVLPYREIFQSGVLFFGYNFGLPVIAADVGSLREDVVEGRTGFMCRSQDPGDLAATIGRYFNSDLFHGLEERRQDVRSYASARHAWNTVADLTAGVYRQLLEGRRDSDDTPDARVAC